MITEKGLWIWRWKVIHNSAECTTSSEDGSHLVKGSVNGGKFKVIRKMVNTMVVWVSTNKSKTLG